MLELCMSGHALSILRLSSRAHTMKAFIGRLMCGRVGSSRDPLLPLPGEPRITLALYIFPANTKSAKQCSNFYQYDRGDVKDITD